MRDCPIDFLDTSALFRAGGRDFTHDVGHALNRGDDFIHGTPGFVDQAAAGIDLLA